MANGRMISRDICSDKRINDLSSDLSRLGFTWIITLLDREGRVHGDPAVVRSMIFPRRQDVTIDHIEEIILEWFRLGLVVWYEANDDLWLWFPNFDKHQVGLRKEREAPSHIPDPTAEGVELVRSRYGVDPELVGLREG